MKTGQYFEEKFRQWCRKQGWFIKKLLTHTVTGQGGNQEADFIVANNEKVYFVECKSRFERMSFKDLTQSKKLQLLQAKTNKIIPIILIYIQKEKTIVKLSLKEFLDIQNTLKFKNGKNKKSFTLNDIKEEYKYTWKTLEL